MEAKTPEVVKEKGKIVLYRIYTITANMAAIAEHVMRHFPAATVFYGIGMARELGKSYYTQPATCVEIAGFDGDRESIRNLAADLALLNDVSETLVVETFADIYLIDSPISIRS